MHLKTFSLPLLAVICTLSLGDVRPVAAAVYFPTSLGAGFPVAVQRFVQQHVFSQSDPDPEDFWQRARELGDRARRFGDKLMKDAAEQSQEIRDKIGELTERMEAVVRGATALNEELHTSAALPFVDNVAEDLERAFAAVLAELEVLFPAPDQAPNHAQRKEVVAVALDKAGVALMGVCTKYGMDEQRAREHWGTVRPAIENMVMVLGDLAEQHPDLLQALLFTGAVLLIPEYWLLRPLLGVFGFGPTGPVKGTTASWAQRVFYGAAVNKGSWFAMLDKAAMTFKAPGWWASVGGIIGVGLGAVGAFFGGCGGRA
ncbi:hypothetical protein B0H17DRAFT_1330256 [Mycena rosella]|uniref:Uncharacterized protein n=1 Tax=Mycena rosella TaxID=1033263 RepID=A0AAD7GGM4_MYCRO|nr:hypothetical protein B0H17DRAFT_1330256 [Mycena rosella]